MSPETEAMWKSLSKMSLEAQQLTIAERCCMSWLNYHSLLVAIVQFMAVHCVALELLIAVKKMTCCHVPSLFEMSVVPTCKIRSDI